jgi:hypothetical protein
MQFASELAWPGRTYVAAAVAPIPEVAKTNDQIVKTVELAPDKYNTDTIVVKLIITVQHIMTKLRAAKAQDGCFAIIMTDNDSCLRFPKENV